MSRAESAAFAWDVAGTVVSYVAVLAIILLALALVGEIRR